MPVTARFPIAEVIAACKRFYAARRRKVLVEYLMLAGVNDRPEQARALARLLDAKVVQAQPDPLQRDRRWPRRFRGSSRGDRRLPRGARPSRARGDRARRPRARDRSRLRAARRNAVRLPAPKRPDDRIAAAGRCERVRAVIAVEDLRKRYGKTQAVDGLSLHGRARPGGRLPRPQRRRQDDDAAHPARTRAAPTRGRRRFSASTTAQLERPFCQVGAVLEASGFHPGRKARNHLRVLARGRQFPRSASTRCWSSSASKAQAKKRVGAFSLGMRQRLGLWPRRCSATRAC